MSATQAFVLAVAAVAVLASIAVLAVAFRKTPDRTPDAPTDPRALRKDRARQRAAATAERAAETEAAGAVAVLVEHEEPEPVPDPLEERPVVTREEFGVTRRQFFNRALLGVFGVFLLQFAIASLAFIWPKLRAGGFGGKIDAGDADEVRNAINRPDGTIAPLFVPAAQAYIVPFTADPDGSSFENPPAPIIADGLMALWQRCVHLGCRVPVCLPSQGFECPCHGSRYNFHGEYDSGPAPRNLDRFSVEIDDANRLIVDTGTIIQTARAKVKTIAYPQGPSCLSAGAGAEE